MSDVTRLLDAAAGGDRQAAAALLSLVYDELRKFAAEGPAVAAVVNVRYFAGLTVEHAADAMGISVRTTNRHWEYAKAWLFQQLGRTE